VSTLEVPGAILHYETQGSGPVLVLVPGANGEAGIFKPLADALQDAFTVVRYDRRGFSDSRPALLLASAAAVWLLLKPRPAPAVAALSEARSPGFDAFADCSPYGSANSSMKGQVSG
jgi:pimeloyl-ACP methyl ester carboxylesterase